MTEPGPFGGDPFGGMPFLGDLFRMVQGQGPVSWEAAHQLAVAIATDGQPEPNVDPLERMRLEQLGRVAEIQVATVTGLDTAVKGRPVEVVPVTRTRWVTDTIAAWQPLFGKLADALSVPADGGLGNPAGLPSDHPAAMGDDLSAAGADAFLANMLQALSPMLLGMTAGSMVGHLAKRSFGIYDLPVPRVASHEVPIVPATIDGFADEWSIDGDDLRLWVLLHELTHHAVLNVPHVRGRLESLLGAYAAGFRADPSSFEHRLAELDPADLQADAGMAQLFGDPEVLLGAVQSPEQRELLPQLEAIIAVILGYVDHVMDRIGTSLIGSYGMVTEAMRRRRVEATDADRFVERLFGLQLTQNRFDRATAFADGVAERVGFEGFERLWQAEQNLPTPAEVDAPGLWLARIDLPTD
jgi:putative hydrolase